MKKIKQAFTLFRLSRIYDGALKVWCSGTMLALPMLLFLNLNISESNALYIGIGCGLQVVGFICFICLVIRRHEKVEKSAKAFDEQYNSCNRFETYLQLEKSSHILKEQQKSDTLKFYNQQKFSLKMYSVIGVALLTLLLTGLNLMLLKNIYAQNMEVQAEVLQGQKVTENIVAKQEERQRLAQETAQLIITRPEDSEQQAKPFDEIEWQGEGDSPHGFKSITLTVYVNSELRQEIPPEELPKESGKISFYSFLSLEDLEVNPFDLVSYHLTGTAQVGGKEITIYSPPGFIEIRPFREDIQTLDSLEGSSSEASTSIKLFLMEQIQLNKESLSLKIYLQNPTDDELDLAELFSELSSNQQLLTSSVDEFLADSQNRTLPTEIINSLEQAHEEMSKSSKSLQDNSIDPSIKSQQLAITHLIQALKNIQKVNSTAQGKPSPQSPFEDKQEYETSEETKANNAHNQLQQLAEEQKSLNQEIEQAKNGETQSELAKKQDELASKLESIKEKSAPNKEFSDKLQQSQNSMNSSSETLNSGRTTAASQYGEQAAAQLEGAAKEIEKISNNQTRETLNDIAEELEQMEQDSATKELLNKMKKELAQVAQKQGETGTLSNAQKLNSLANGVSNIIGETNPATQAQLLQELKQTINEMRLDNFDAQQYLEQAVGELNDNSKYLKYLSSRPEELTPQVEKELMTDIENLVANTELALDMLKNQSKNEEVKSALGELQQELANIDLTQNRATLSKDLLNFAENLSTQISKLSRRVEVFVFDAEEVPKKYRKDTAEYFERLSNHKGNNE